MPVKSRPVFLEIPNIRLPIPGIVSILHRISGVILFVMLPVFAVSPVRYVEPRVGVLKTYRAIVFQSFGQVDF